jgi:hypothetical protein
MTAATAPGPNAGEQFLRTADWVRVHVMLANCFHQCAQEALSK